MTTLSPSLRAEALQLIEDVLRLDVQSTREPWTSEPNPARGAWIKGNSGEWAALACGDTDIRAKGNALLIALYRTAAPRLASLLKGVIEGEESGADVALLELELAAARSEIELANEEIARAEASRVKAERERDEAKELLSTEEELNAEYDRLGTMQRERERPFIEAWQKATGQPNTLPDYGAIMSWICDRAEAAETALREADAALMHIAAGLTAPSPAREASAEAENAPVEIVKKERQDNE